MKTIAPCPLDGKPGIMTRYPNGAVTFYHADTGELHKVDAPKNDKTDGGSDESRD